jgi:hypothetical protein
MFIRPASYLWILLTVALGSQKPFIAGLRLLSSSILIRTSYSFSADLSYSQHIHQRTKALLIGKQMFRRIATVFLHPNDPLFYFFLLQHPISIKSMYTRQKCRIGGRFRPLYILHLPSYLSIHFVVAAFLPTKIFLSCTIHLHIPHLILRCCASLSSSLFTFKTIYLYNSISFKEARFFSHSIQFLGHCIP